MGFKTSGQLEETPWWVHLLSVGAILIICVAYFFPQFQGKKIQQGDIISAIGESAEPKSYQTGSDDIFLWNNGIFGGMPDLISVPARNNLIVPLYKIIRLGIPEPIGLFFAMMLLAYLMFILLGIPPFLSVILAISIGLSTNNLILWEAGHNSKVRTLAFTPIIIAGVLYVFEQRKYMMGAVLLAIGFGLSIYSRHPQMTYYLLLVFMVYGIIKVIRTIKDQSWSAFMKGTAIILVTALLALGSSASKMMCLYEYNQSTMRGKPVIQQEIKRNTDAKSSSEVDGLDWDYAMQWSNTSMDVLASFIPGIVGGGSGQTVTSGYLWHDQLRQNKAPLYWGGLPFTEGPIYFGAVILFLFVFGLFYVKGDIKLWLGLGVLLTLLLSMGKHFSILNRFFFDYVPLYNKFRTPQSVLSVTIFFLPVLGGLAIKQLISAVENLKKEKKSKKVIIPKELQKSLIWAVAITGGISLIVILLGPMVFSFSSPSDQRYIQQGVDPEIFKHDRIKLLRADGWRTLLLISASFSALWFFVHKKISRNLMILILGGLIIFDFWGIGVRYLGHQDFVQQDSYSKNFQPRPVDQQIMSQEKGREYYRVLDLTVNTFNSSYTSNFHNHVGGYNAAKLQRYQDVIERHISRNNQAVLDMLNTKYIISQGDNGQAVASINPGALGNAWFVESVKTVERPIEEIEALTGFNPSETAIVLDKEFEGYIGEFDPTKDESGTISLSNYKPNHLTYTFRANSEQLVVFSETWYGPNLGWQAYIDGKLTNHIRANYIQRAMRIPEGEHTIEFKFDPACYRIGEQISLISSVLLSLGIIGVLGLSWYSEKKRIS